MNDDSCCVSRPSSFPSLSLSLAVDKYFYVNSGYSVAINIIYNHNFYGSNIDV